jgi:hypothetical protein
MDTVPSKAYKSKAYPPQNGDFVIQSSDRVYFGVHRLLLTLASPIMSDMFALGGGENLGTLVITRL